MVQHKNITHSAARPYACTDCDKTFKYKCVRDRHIVTCHQNRSLEGEGGVDDNEDDHDDAVGSPHKRMKAMETTLEGEDARERRNRELLLDALFGK